jgi:glyoxylase-like metal-dependent hydrolase (beta-lactamase superfamily II)
MHPQWLANSWLVADRPGGHAVLIDTGGPTEPILAKIDEQSLTVDYILCTHGHVDHIANNDFFSSRFGCAVCGHRSEGSLSGGLDRELDDGDELIAGELRIRAMHLPGHTAGQLAYLVNESNVFTGDTLFRGAVGGTRGSGHAGFGELRHSIMEVLMKLPGETVVHPGHAGETTIGDEWERNPFIRMWRGIDRPQEKRCEALGRPATLLLRARDYDGGTKCQVRFDDDGAVAIVAGSRVRTL